MNNFHYSECVKLLLFKRPFPEEALLSPYIPLDNSFVVTTIFRELIKHMPGKRVIFLCSMCFCLFSVQCMHGCTFFNSCMHRIHIGIGITIFMHNYFVCWIHGLYLHVHTCTCIIVEVWLIVMTLLLHISRWQSMSILYIVENIFVGNNQFSDVPGCHIFLENMV